MVEGKGKKRMKDKKDREESGRKVNRERGEEMERKIFWRKGRTGRMSWPESLS